MLVLLIGRIYDVAIEMDSGVVHDDRLRHLSNITVITATI
jgi:hypothetical protein